MRERLCRVARFEHFLNSAGWPNIAGDGNTVPLKGVALAAKVMGSICGESLQARTFGCSRYAIRVTRSHENCWY